MPAANTEVFLLWDSGSLVGVYADRDALRAKDSQCRVDISTVDLRSAPALLGQEAGSSDSACAQILGDLFPA